MLKGRLKAFIVDTPLEPIALAARNTLRRVTGRPVLEFKRSDDYWERRYEIGGNSGAGSYGRLATYKAEVLNEFVAREGVSSVIEFGSGDGNQTSLAEYPHYVGVDVSSTAVRACRDRFAENPTKTFMTVSEYDGRTADLSLSLDVIYHLVEDEVFETYMATLFDAAERFVIVYASDRDEQPRSRHVRHRKFTDWVAAHRPDFRRIAHLPNRYPFDRQDPDNTSFADFHIFQKAVP